MPGKVELYFGLLHGLGYLVNIRYFSLYTAVWRPLDCRLGEINVRLPKGLLGFEGGRRMSTHLEAIAECLPEARERLENWCTAKSLSCMRMARGALISGTQAQFAVAFEVDFGEDQTGKELRIPEELNGIVTFVKIRTPPSYHGGG